MTLVFGKAYITKKGTIDQKITVDAVFIETRDDMLDLRDNHADWHEGALSVLTYPTAPHQGFVSHTIPKAFSGGIRILPGATIYKDEAGNFGFCQREEMTTA